VTAQRREESAQDVGVSLSAVGAEDMRRLAITNAKDISKFAPGVLLDSIAGGGYTANLTIRGIAQTDFSSTQESPNSLYLDDVYNSSPNAAAFSLYDQEGTVISFARFRGQRVILNFIYTRCPIPTMCSAATARLAALQKLVREKALPDVAFVSISLDPAHDTPPVLKAYAATHGADLANWSFLTGPESAVRDLLTQFGVIAIPSGNFYAHSLATILVGRDGKLALRLDDNSPDWTPAEFISHLTPP
jgi:protein SCO1/2